MIVAEDIILRTPATRSASGKSIYSCSLVSDTKEEVIAIGKNGSGVVGFPPDSEFAPLLTSCITKEYEVGKLGSDNTWVFV